MDTLRDTKDVCTQTEEHAAAAAAAARSLSRVQLCATPWTAAHQAPPAMGFSRQEHWSGVPLPSPKEHVRMWQTGGRM